MKFLSKKTASVCLLLILGAYCGSAWAKDNEEAGKQAGKKVDQFQDKVKEKAKDAKEKAHELADKAKEKANDAKEKVTEWKDKAKEKIHEKTK